MACVLNERGYGILRASEDVVIPPHETIMIRTCREGSLNGEIRCLYKLPLDSSGKIRDVARTPANTIVPDMQTCIMAGVALPDLWRDSPHGGRR